MYYNHHIKQNNLSRASILSVVRERKSSNLHKSKEKKKKKEHKKTNQEIDWTKSSADILKEKKKREGLCMHELHYSRLNIKFSLKKTLNESP